MFSHSILRSRMAVSVMAISTSLMVIPAYAQPLPELKVERKASSPKKQKLKSEATGNSLTPPAQAATSASTPSLTSPSFAQASNEAARIPGSVTVIADKDFKDRQSTTINPRI